MRVSDWNFDMMSYLWLIFVECEVVFYDDFCFEFVYDYGEDDEWDEDVENWMVEDEVVVIEVVVDVKDESIVYFEFFNEEVCLDWYMVFFVWEFYIDNFYRCRSLVEL